VPRNLDATIFRSQITDASQEFSFPKPEFKQKLVFLDSTGKRSKAAAEAAQKGGYENVRSYGGGVNEYHQKQKEGK
jgi:rhodanese-related sulfurtransferase